MGAEVTLAFNGADLVVVPPQQGYGPNRVTGDGFEPAGGELAWHTRERLVAGRAAAGPEPPAASSL